jgi:hypothetical protein
MELLVQTKDQVLVTPNDKENITFVHNSSDAESDKKIGW